MKILLIDPPFQRFMKFKCDWFPLGLGYLASALIREGHETHIYNAEFHNQQQYLRTSKLMESFDMYLDALHDRSHDVWSDIRQTIARYAPDVVGITSPTVKFASAVAIAEICKKHFPQIPVILGGPHATNCPHDALSKDVIDIAVIGEGEQTFVELVDALQNWRDISDIKGIGYRDADGVITLNPKRELIEDIDTLPFPARDRLLNGERLESESMGNMITSRGCPFQCTYCAAHTVWTRKVRFRSIENIVEEVKLIHEKFGTLQFTFWDDCFTLKKSRVLHFCELLRQEGLNINWGCNTRFDLLDEELIKEMKYAGCNNIELGVESGSPKVLEKIRKGISTDQMHKVAELLNRYKMYWSAFFMIGFPYEDARDILDTVNLMKKIKPCWCTFSIFTPYPGTELYEDSDRMGLLPEEFDWSAFGHQSPHNSFTAHLSPDRFSEIAKLTAREIDKYNRKPSLLLKKGITRIPLYWSSPKTFFGDSKKLFGWLGIA